MPNPRSPQNLFRLVAAKKNRDYITPEDVGEALQRYPLDRVRRDLLAVIGSNSSHLLEVRLRLGAWPKRIA